MGLFLKKQAKNKRILLQNERKFIIMETIIMKFQSKLNVVFSGSVVSNLFGGTIYEQDPIYRNGTA